MTAEPRAAAPARAARFEPLTRLATGGMADIWLARELGAAGLERFVVIKRLLPHLARDPDIVDMFVSEARFVARLVHPNVVQIHELCEDDEGYFLVMEYVAGCSVRELTSAARKAERLLPPDVAVCIVEQACRGAHAAHELKDPAGQPLGLVHRDISPHNLMVGPQGDVKLLDFGIAKATAAAEATRTGTLKGKQGYMSPEQCRTTRVDRRSDVFTLGIVCWELLTGQRLFKRETEFTTMKAIEGSEAPLVTEVRPDLPPAFDAVVARALDKDLEARWQTADDFRRVLIAAADEADIHFSRDSLAVHVMDLLGAKLEHREKALRGAASLTAHPDEEELHRVLARSDASMVPLEERTSRTGSDDVATVVQRRGGRSGAPPAFETSAVDDAEPTSVREPELDDDA
ncbi:MAG: serine/threonine protein kinase, partial [Deltaproteobacteria bacterium]|nr:serine/threonine protein kinase [Deltaproteobacteria bacterium]MBW2531852.1 serine/threonine protein kinase [Deltaproteobacteria bacterium]